MEQLGGIDRAYLGIESDDVPADFLNILVLDPSTAPDRHDFERVRAEALARVPTVEAMTRRLATAPLGGAPEQWVTDPDFDVDRHLDRLACPSPGDLPALQRLALEVCSAPLDRRRPLWRMWYVEGLADGRAALLLKMHHAAFDGMGAVEALASLVDAEPLPFDPAATTPATVDGDRVPSGPEVLLRSLPGQAMAPLRAARGLATLAGAQLATLGASLLGTGGDDDGSVLTGDWAGPPPTVVFNRPPATFDRSLALTTVGLDDVKEVAKAAGVTVNDVVLTVVTGALRSYLAGRDELPDRPLRAVCPVNVRTDEDSSGGNAFTAMLVPLPTHLDDPAERLRYVAEATSARKPTGSGADAGSGDATSARTFLELIDLVPSAMFAVMGGLAGGGALTSLPPTANLVMSNVRGSDDPLYLAGARIEHMHGRTMAGPGLGMMIHCAGYAGQLDFGVTVLRDLVPDPETITEALAEQLALLR